MSVVKNSSRTKLGADTENDAARVAKAGLMVQSNEKLHIHFKNTSIKASSLNPRRITLDRAGVTPEAVARLAIGEGETKKLWQERLNDHIETLSEDNKAVWLELTDLAFSILEQGILQPIIVNTNHVIVAGERRWTASQLAGRTTSRVIVREFTELEEAIFRLAENLRRSNLTVAEIVMGLRKVIAMSLGECSPDNKLIKIDAISELTGAAQTTATYYRALCRLPDDDPVLADIKEGKYTSLRVAYRDASLRVREIIKGEPIEVAGQDDGQSDDDKSPQVLTKKSNTDEGKRTVVKLNIELRPSVSKLIDVFANLEGISKPVSSEISALSGKWKDADNKERTELLTQAFNLAVEFLESK